jgi:hypothetical protein
LLAGKLTQLRPSKGRAAKDWVGILFKLQVQEDDKDSEA